ncbi:efflux RND transporter permease subunit [Marinobacterium rhizophilum]|uniref:efflux RND transporter permease subunit n=1 Tax=Marinobacterium rhizophilum TaxID=420402 RepID=UPI0003650FD8|nr:efflux RND transporter permease subunit [Marinobacterium rhizophilum]
MNITLAAIRNNRLTLVITLCILFAGVQIFLQMPRAYDPGFIIRTAQITTQFPGASPQRVEQLISARLEDVVKEIPELDFVKSESRTGVSIITVNISESYKDMRPIWDQLRRKVDDVRADMPDGVIGPYVNDEFGDVFGIVLTVTGEGFSYAEVERVAEQVRDKLQQLPDAAKVEIYGAQEERIFVEFDNARLSELGISPYQLSQALAARNIVIPGGSIRLGRERIALEPSGNFETVADIGRTILRISGSEQLIYLEDIADLHRGYIDPPQSVVHSSGTQALALGIAMREGGNNIELGQQVRESLAQLRPAYPYGIEFDVVNFVPDEVDQKVRGFVINLLQAVAVVTLVMLVSLGLRTGLIVSSLIPLAMLAAIIVMSLFDIGLDQISLAALIIALGMLVDNGIVMSEGIMVQMEQGKRALDAAVDSAAELQVPLLTASLTTAAAFLPIYLAESNVGEFTASLFKVVTITLLSSWVISLTIIPMLCVYCMKVPPKVETFDSALYRRYRQGLLWMLKHRLLTLLATLLLFACAMLGFSYIPNQFFPPSDRLYFKVEMELPTGTDIGRTEQVVSEIEHYVRAGLAGNGTDEEGATNWISYIGNAGPKFILSHNPKPANPSYALIIVNVSSPEQVDRLMPAVKRYAFEHFPDLSLKVKRIDNGPAIENPVEVRLSGEDMMVLSGAVDTLKKRMLEIGGLDSIDDDWGQRIKKLDIRIDQPRALRAGVTSQDIAISLQAGLSGLELTEYREGEDSIPVVLRSRAATEQDIGKVEALSVYVQSIGKSVPLTQVADIDVAWQPARIYRRNGVRTVTVGAQLQPGVTAAEQFAELTPWLEERRADWGSAIRYELGGENESSAKANQSIVDKLPVAALIILVLLVAQSNSLRHTFIVLLTIPLGLIGVSAGLLLSHSFFGFMTFLGIISLAGIVINNAIVLLDRIKIEQDNGVTPHQAIVSAAVQRARPILLTTATTILGLVPLYLGGGEMWEPMTIAIMAGLLLSTAMTLGVVPVLYALLYRVEYPDGGDADRA